MHQIWSQRPMKRMKSIIWLLWSSSGPFSTYLLLYIWIPIHNQLGKLLHYWFLFSNSYPKFWLSDNFCGYYKPKWLLFLPTECMYSHCKEIHSSNIHNMHGKFEWKFDKYGIKHLIANCCAICNRMAEVKSGEGCSNYRCCISSISKPLKLLWFLEFILNIALCIWFAIHKQALVLLKKSPFEAKIHVSWGI